MQHRKNAKTVDEFKKFSDSINAKLPPMPRDLEEIIKKDVREVPPSITSNPKETQPVAATKLSTGETSPKHRKDKEGSKKPNLPTTPEKAEEPASSKPTKKSTFSFNAAASEFNPTGIAPLVEDPQFIPQNAYYPALAYQQPIHGYNPYINAQVTAKTLNSCLVYAGVWILPYTC